MGVRLEYRLSVIVVEDASSLAKASLIGTTIESLTCICLHVNCKNKTCRSASLVFLSGSLSNRVDETILVKELSSVRLLNSFFSCWSK